MASFQCHQAHGGFGFILLVLLQLLGAIIYLIAGRKRV